MKFKALEQLISGRRSNHGAWLTTSLSCLFLLIMEVGRVRVCPWTYAYTLAAIHAVNMREVRKLCQLHLLTINAPLIVKDEVDKAFELILFVTKQKKLCGLKAYCYLGPARPGAFEGPGTGGSMITILIE